MPERDVYVAGTRKRGGLWKRFGHCDSLDGAWELLHRNPPDPETHAESAVCFAGRHPDDRYRTHAKKKGRA